MIRLVLTASSLALTALLSIACNSTFTYFGDASPSLEATRYEYARTHPGGEFNNAILAGKIKKGMSRRQVAVSWGRPDSVGDGDRPGIDHMWAYHENDPSRGRATYMLRFDGDALASVDVIRGLLYVSPSSNEEVELPEPITADGKNP